MHTSAPRSTPNPCQTTLQVAFHMTVNESDMFRYADSKVGTDTIAPFFMSIPTELLYVSCFTSVNLGPNFGPMWTTVLVVGKLKQAGRFCGSKSTRCFYDLFWSRRMYTLSSNLCMWVACCSPSRTVGGTSNMVGGGDVYKHNAVRRRRQGHTGAQDKYQWRDSVLCLTCKVHTAMARL